jgi:LmbE family N-acetylglucosaminyl deacetylase
LQHLGGDSQARFDARHVAVVVAHPDDETIGCGAQLRRLRQATIVVVTDGAPRDLHDAHHYGFRTAEEYAQAREREHLGALAIAGASLTRSVRFRVADQQAAFLLPQITRRLARLFATREIGVVLTHAYEGGHPDHDATAFCVHAAAVLRRVAGASVAVVEMPFYRQGRGGPAYQEFHGTPRADEVVVHLTRGQQRLKQQMIGTYATQARVLAPFSVELERFRPAPPYDFTELPNGGRLLYEKHNRGLDGPGWIGLARTAQSELRLKGGTC